MTAATVTPATPRAAPHGATVINDRVRERLIEHAVLSVPGVVRHKALVPGQSLPSIAVGGSKAARTVEVAIAASWPVDSASTIDGVRAAVSHELSETLSEHPERIDVQITRVDSDRTPAQVADAYATGPDDEVRTATATVRPRHAPRSIAGSTIIGVLVALGAIVAGCIAVRDALIAAGWVQGTAWITPLLAWVGNAHWQWWTWSAAVLAALVGLALLVIAVKPRRRTHIPIGDGIWIPRSSADRWPADAAKPAPPRLGDDR